MKTAGIYFPILGGVLLFCVSVYLVIGVITSKKGICLKSLLIGEEYVVALIISVVNFSVFSFPLALIVWVIVFWLMHYFLRDNRRIISYIVHYEQNKNMFNHKQMKLFSQLNPNVVSPGAILWMKTFRHFKRDVLRLIDSIDSPKIKSRTLPISVFALGTMGIFAVLCADGYLIENTNSSVMMLIENYTILSSCLVILYLLLYMVFVKNIFHYMYGHIRLYKIIFGVFSAFMYIVVTMISLNM